MPAPRGVLEPVGAKVFVDEAVLNPTVAVVWLSNVPVGLDTDDPVEMAVEENGKFEVMDRVDPVFIAVKPV